MWTLILGFTFFFVIIPTAAILASKFINRESSEEMDDIVVDETYDKDRDWDPHAAFKRVADRKGMTVEQLQAHLRARALYVSEHPNECVFCHLITEPVHTFESCPQVAETIRLNSELHSKVKSRLSDNLPPVDVEASDL